MTWLVRADHAAEIRLSLFFEKGRCGADTVSWIAQKSGFEFLNSIKPL
jgi:hypothetical protein